jgi:hypothetical protein
LTWKPVAIHTAQSATTTAPIHRFGRGIDRPKYATVKTEAPKKKTLRYQCCGCMTHIETS